MWGQLLLVVPLCILEGGMNLKYKPEQFELEETTIWSFKERGNWATHRGDYRGHCPPQVPRNLILKYTNIILREQEEYEKLESQTNNFN